MMNEKDIERIEKQAGISNGSLEKALIVTGCLLAGWLIIIIGVIIHYWSEK